MIEDILGLFNCKQEGSDAHINFPALIEAAALTSSTLLKTGVGVGPNMLCKYSKHVTSKEAQAGKCPPPTQGVRGAPSANFIVYREKFFRRNPNIYQTLHTAIHYSHVQYYSTKMKKSV